MTNSIVNNLYKIVIINNFKTINLCDYNFKYAILYFEKDSIPVRSYNKKINVLKGSSCIVKNDDVIIGSEKTNKNIVIILFNVNLDFPELDNEFIKIFNNEEIKKKIQTIVEVNNLKLYNYELKSINILYEIIYQVFNDENKFKNNIEKIEHLIERNIHLNYQVEELAKIVGMSIANLQRIFKKATNYTIKEYSNIVKINVAKKLLETTSLDINQIAYHVGFINISYFNRKFKEITNKTPTEYRINN